MHFLTIASVLLATAAAAPTPQDPVSDGRRTFVGISSEGFNYGSTVPANIVFKLATANWCPNEGGCKTSVDNTFETLYSQDGGTTAKYINYEIEGNYLDQIMKNELFAAASTALTEGLDQRQITDDPVYYENRQSRSVTVSMYDEDDDLKGTLSIRANYPEEPAASPDKWCEGTVSTATSIISALALANPLFGIAAGVFGVVNVACQNT